MMVENARSILPNDLLENPGKKVLEDFSNNWSLSRAKFVKYLYLLNPLFWMTFSDIGPEDSEISDWVNFPEIGPAHDP